MVFKLISAVITRFLFIVLSVIASWRVTWVKDNEFYWLLIILNIPLVVEMILNLTRRRGNDYKWFSPATFLFLVSIIPSVWILELDQNKTLADSECNTLDSAENFRRLSKLLMNINNTEQIESAGVSDYFRESSGGPTFSGVAYIHVPDHPGLPLVTAAQPVFRLADREHFIVEYVLPQCVFAVRSLHSILVYGPAHVPSPGSVQDDILIFSRSLEEHRVHVRRVLQWLLEKQLLVKAEKYEFHAQTTPFLGHDQEHHQRNYEPAIPLQLMAVKQLGNYEPAIPLQPRTVISSEKILSLVCASDWILALHQLLLILLILGKWLLPTAGKLTRNQLSQLLLTFVGTAADILEFTSETLFDIKGRSWVMVYVILAVWTWSMLQFPLHFSVIQDSSDDVTEPAPSLLSRINPDTWAIVEAFLIQDGPFLLARLIVMIYFKVIHQMLIFFTIKNFLVVILNIYRLTVLEK
ncbi:transmembrane protein 26-like [Pholidichthys leucotaenia]